MTESALNRTGTGEFLGHPTGLVVCFLTEMWERFSYYGMRALLVLFMTAPLAGEEAHRLRAVGDDGNPLLRHQVGELALRELHADLGQRHAFRILVEHERVEDAEV